MCIFFVLLFRLRKIFYLTHRNIQPDMKKKIMRRKYYLNVSRDKFTSFFLGLDLYNKVLTVCYFQCRDLFIFITPLSTNVNFEVAILRFFMLFSSSYGKDSLIRSSSVSDSVVYQHWTLSFLSFRISVHLFCTSDIKFIFIIFAVLDQKCYTKRNIQIPQLSCSFILTEQNLMIYCRTHPIVNHR